MLLLTVQSVETNVCCKNLLCKLSKLMKAMIVALNKFISIDIHIKLIHLAIDIENHHMIQSALTCAAKVSFQTSQMFI